MAFDTYLKIATIDGEATAKGFEKNIEIFSFSWGASAPVTVGPGTGGVSAGRVSISSFNIMKKTDATSTLLFQAACTGQHFDNMVVSMRKASGTAGGQAVFLIYTFNEVMVESIQWSGSSGGDDTPTESVSFAFGKVQVQYNTQKKDGTLTSGTPVVWDQTTVTNA
ncbi:MAG TPA: type VI secretion system tube protein Hcp [Gemmatirosa sp.]